MRKVNFKLHSIDEGFCRINYTFKSEKNNLNYYYCLQNEGEKFGGIIFYKSTSELEPCYPIEKLKPNVCAIFEKPNGDSELEKLVIKWIDKKSHNLMETSA